MIDDCDNTIQNGSHLSCFCLVLFKWSSCMLYLTVVALLCSVITYVLCCRDTQIADQLCHAEAHNVLLTDLAASQFFVKLMLL